MNAGTFREPRGGMVVFVGAGPGDPELLTVRGRRVIEQADLVVWADSLVHPGVAALARPDAEVVGSMSMHLEAISEQMIAAARAGKLVARVQSGDPAVYGAMHEQMVLLDAAEVPYAVVPGVSAVFAAAAALNAELTVPEVAQTVILTRLPSRTTIPEQEQLRAMAAHGGTIALFLSIVVVERVVSELIAGGYPEDTPAAVLYRVSWDDETIIRGTLADIAAASRAAGLTRQALILVGRAIDPELRRAAAALRSNLYDPTYSHVFRGWPKGAADANPARLSWPMAPMVPMSDPHRGTAAMTAGRGGIAVLAVTPGGARLGGEVAATLGPSATLHVSERFLTEAPPGAVPVTGPLAARVADLFPRAEALVFVLATGATVRLVAPLLGQKQDDPAVLAIDEAGRHVVALLGGHQSGANALATRIADAIGAEPVISTASDALGLPALDLLGHAEGWRIEATSEALKQASAAVVAGEAVAIYQDAGSHSPLDALPAEWPRVDTLDDLQSWPGPRAIVTDRALDAPDVPAVAATVLTGTSTDSTPLTGGPVIVYRPPTLVLGVGCSLGAPADEIEALARDALAEAGLAWGSVGIVTTIDRRLTEPGVIELARRAEARLVVYPAEALAAVPDLPNPSAEVARHVGTPGVCEPAALLASGADSLLLPKRRSAHVTVAIARRAAGPSRPGKLWLVGIGPGPLDLMTARARRVLRNADVVIGYRGYLEMVSALVPERRLMAYELGQERERAAEAIGLARAGRSVALVSSGDVGVYGMAGLVFELLDESSHEDAPPVLNNAGQQHHAAPPEVEVVPGVTAASAAGALLGAPLMLDFAAISLSDLLVSWAAIRQRLVAAAEGDLVVVLYNPASARRRRPFEEALNILREHRPPETPVGLVREAYRPDQAVTVTTLGALPVQQVDMRTVVVIGCSRTATLDGRIVTRRGYLGEGRHA